MKWVSVIIVLLLLRNVALLQLSDGDDFSEMANNLEPNGTE